MSALALALMLACGAHGQAVRAIEAHGGRFAVNDVPAVTLSLGTYKTALIHPQDPALLVKVFQPGWADPAQEQRRELADIARLGPLTPRLVLSGTANAIPYVVVERVDGLNLERPTPIKLEETRALFLKLRRAGLKMSDVESLVKLRQNLMVGSTRSGGFQGWLVDPEVSSGRHGAAELAAFYDGLERRLSAR